MAVASVTKLIAGSPTSVADELKDGIEPIDKTLRTIMGWLMRCSIHPGRELRVGAEG